MPLALLLAGTIAPGCRVHSYSKPPRIVGEGIVRGHAALGIRDEDELLRLGVSLNPGRVVDFSLWRLLRVEAGVAGVSLGVGPIDLGLGALLYDPDVPRMISERRDSDSKPEAHDEAWEDDDFDDGDDDGWGDDDAAPSPQAVSDEPVGRDRWR